jgi:hypothetical protein
MGQMLTGVEKMVYFRLTLRKLRGIESLENDMKTGLIVLSAMAVLAAPAFGQIRPEDCRPVLPVLDKAAAAIPQDVVTEPAGPAVAAKKRFLGLPFLLPLLAGGGACVIFCGGNNNNGTPEEPPPTSPA